jgi:hypothetical protein
MRDLIKRILKESVSQKLESIEYVGRVSTKKMKSLLEGTKYEYIDRDLLDLIDKTHTYQKQLSNELNPLLAQYEDKRTKQVKKAYFNIQVDFHFSERTFRKQTFPSDPDFVDIQIDEGINVVKTNIDDIWKMIYSKKLGYMDVLRLKSINGVNYEILVRLNTPGKLDKLPIYDITLFNQIKGKEKNFKKETKIIRTYNPLG